MFDLFTLFTICIATCTFRIGDPEHHNCVTTPDGEAISINWGPDKWPIKELCNPEENADTGCCLKRNLWPEVELGTIDEIGDIVTRSSFGSFESGIAYHHLIVHRLFGMSNVCPTDNVHCDAAGYLPNDPIFMLLHSFTAYLRAVWASCHGYDLLSNEELDDHPEAYDPQCADGYPDCGVIELDDVYEFGDMVNQQWSITSTMDVTPRKMWDFNDWNVRFDIGSFIERAGLDISTGCDIDHLRNSKWLTSSKDSKTKRNEIEMLEEIELEHSKALLERLALTDPALYNPPHSVADISSEDVNVSKKLEHETLHQPDLFMYYVDVNIDSVDESHFLNDWNWSGDLFYVLAAVLTLLVLLSCARHYILARGRGDALTSNEGEIIYGSI